MILEIDRAMRSEGFRLRAAKDLMVYVPQMKTDIQMKEWAITGRRAMAFIAGTSAGIYALNQNIPLELLALTTGVTVVGSTVLFALNYALNIRLDREIDRYYPSEQ